jgi:hypothetical protein
MSPSMSLGRIILVPPPVLLVLLRTSRSLLYLSGIFCCRLHPLRHLLLLPHLCLLILLLHLPHLLHLHHLLLPLHHQSLLPHHRCVLPVRSLTSTLVVHDLCRHLTLPRPSLDLLPNLLLVMLFVTAAPFGLPIALVSLLPF